MVFSTLFFLTVFLPLTLLACWGLAFVCGKNKFSVNLLLLLASLVFYFWGEGLGVGWLIVCVLANDLLARGIHRARRPPARKALLALAVAANLAFLGWFKYAGFLARSINLLPGIDIPVPEIALPLGISFYTFQAMSYVIDVYRGTVAPARTPVDFGAYLTMFPQLVAGPIVRYADIAAQLRSRSTPIGRVASGMRRFLQGLVKKVLLANTLAEFADRAWGFADAGSVLPVPLAWLALVAYALQIYYDFSGYSDMAIGIGRMLGFDFPENFLHPYAATSVRDFWRRWHVSLSTWFRDYLYIPLGGNRKGLPRTCLNSLIVFALCGLWHGASAMFLLWGLWHGLFLTLERLAQSHAACPGKSPDGPGKSPDGPGKSPDGRAALGHLYATAVFLFGWLLFRCETLSTLGVFLRSLFGAAPAAAARSLFIDVSPKFLLALLFGLLFAYGRPAAKGGSGATPPSLPATLLSDLLLTLLALLALFLLVGGGYNPFLYFRF